MATAAGTVEKLSGYFASSVMAASILSAMAVPLLLLFLSMTLFGSFLILPCVLLAGGVLGWSLCCMQRCGFLNHGFYPLLLCTLMPQAPCLMLISAACMRLSDSLRAVVSRNGLRRPDVSAELRLLAAGLTVKLFTAILFAMLLKRQGLL